MEYNICRRLDMAHNRFGFQSAADREDRCRFAASEVAMLEAMQAFPVSETVGMSENDRAAWEEQRKTYQDARAEINYQRIAMKGGSL